MLAILEVSSRCSFDGSFASALADSAAADRCLSRSTRLKLLRDVPLEFSCVPAILRLVSSLVRTGGSAVTVLVALVGRLWRLEDCDFAPVMRLMLVLLDEDGGCCRLSEVTDNVVGEMLSTVVFW